MLRFYFDIDEWSNFLERIKLLETAVEMALQSGKDDETIMNVRLWASYRGQTLARTGMFFCTHLISSY
jgi:callose synthase